jgi:hypothetical protein
VAGDTDIAIVGAGPYGLSIAAHLRSKGLDFLSFGSPMQNWITQMPKGMLLKSEGFASDLYDPRASFALCRFCEEQGIPYADVGLPVRLETFVAYGLSFQRGFVPEVQNRVLVALCRHPSGFRLQFEDGNSAVASRVILATGLSHFQRLPAELANLPPEFVSHSADHSEPARFKGRDVAVIGGGASATDFAALLAESGASVQLVVRRPSIVFNTNIKFPRPLAQRVRHPITPLGFGSWPLWLYCSAPFTFRYLSDEVRLRKIETTFGPAAGWFMRDRMNGVVIRTGLCLQHAEVSKGRVKLQLIKSDGTEHSLTTEHVIAATGYKVDLGRMPFLSEEIRSKIKAIECSPVLSGYFQSSVPGLYFVGTASANSFGPIMRFVAGAKFTAKRLARHLAERAAFKPRAPSHSLPDVATRGYKKRFSGIETHIEKAN